MTEPMGESFVWQMRVYWEDTDGGGVVYHSRYLNFFERARTEWLRSLGFDQSGLAADPGIVFAVRHMDVDFLSAARLDDELEVAVAVERVGASAVVFEQVMRRRVDGNRLARARVKVACLDARNFAPVRLPPPIRERLAAAG